MADQATRSMSIVAYDSLSKPFSGTLGPGDAKRPFRRSAVGLRPWANGLGVEN